MERGKSRLYLPEDGGRKGGEGERDREKGGWAGRGICESLLPARVAEYKPQQASAGAVISIPSYSRYNENCV